MKIYSIDEYEWPESGFAVLKRMVNAKTRKLSATWNLDDAQTLKNKHGIDMEDEIAKALSEAMDQEILNSLSPKDDE